MTGKGNSGRPAAKQARSALPRGPQALPREQVAADQRERLFEAMIQTVDERGFVASTISDLVERAGVSRRTFYEHFENKDECLLATYDMLVARILSDVAKVDDGLTGLDRLQAVIEALFEATIRRPAAARLVCIELAAAGAPGIERWAKGSTMLTRYIGQLFADTPGTGPIPEPVARAIVGAIRNILYSRVRRKRSSRALRSELSKIVPDLMAWIAGYVPTPEGVPDKPRPYRPRPMRGGRAPGTLSLAPSWSQRQLPPGEHNLPRGFISHNQRERIFDAIARRTATHGYPALGLEDIVSEAAVSLQTFYQHFENKEEAFLATYEVGHAKGMTAVNRSLDLRLDWTENVKLGVAALLEYLTSEPAFAHIACVDVLIAYPHVAARVDEANYSLAELLDLRFDNSTPSRVPSAVVGEAIVGGVFEMLHEYILNDRTGRLPELADHIAYIVLTPLIGAKEAWEVVRRPRNGPSGQRA